MVNRQSKERLFSDGIATRVRNEVTQRRVSSPRLDARGNDLRALLLNTFLPGVILRACETRLVCRSRENLLISFL